jgi:hypothetical protein
VRICRKPYSGNQTCNTGNDEVPQQRRPQPPAATATTTPTPTRTATQTTTPTATPTLVNARLQVSSATLSFPSTVTGQHQQAAANHIVEPAHAKTRPATLIERTAITGPFSIDAVTSTCHAGLNLPPKGKCEFSLTFCHGQADWHILDHRQFDVSRFRRESS